MTRTNRRLLSIGALLAIVVLFFAINIIAGAAFRSSRLDLTENSVYTLSKGSRAVAQKVAEPIRLTLYYSAKQASGRPDIESHAQRVRELLEEYERASGGKVTLEVIEPEPFSDEEEKASQAGLEPTGSATGDPLFLGLVGTNSVDGREVVPFFDPREERFLEYNVSRLLYKLDNPDAKKIGLVTSLPMEGMPFDFRTGQQTNVPPWQVLTQMRGVFEVENLGATPDSIADDIDVLMVVHPKGLPDSTLYAIDQFVLSGRGAIVFVDPLCDVDQSGADPRNPMSQFTAVKNSNLTKLFDAWGIAMEDTKVAADLDAAIRVNMRGASGRPEPVDHVAWLSLKEANINQDDPTTGGLASINVGTAGAITKKEGATVEVVPVLHTGKNSSLIDADKLKFMPDLKALVVEFTPLDRELTLAARVTGMVKSVFPEGKPPKSPEENAAEPPKDEEPSTQPHRAESVAPINVLVVADADVLADDFWIQRLGGQLAIKIAANGDFVIGALDFLGGSTDLIAIRPRGRFNRPFDRVAALRQDAEKKYRAEEQELLTKLNETQSKLTQLQRERGDDQNAMILSPEQQAEFKEFEGEMFATKKRLRDVQRNLNKEVESLGTRLAVWNTAVIPLLVAVGAIGLGAFRAAQHRAERKAVAGKG